MGDAAGLSGRQRLEVIRLWLRERGCLFFPVAGRSMWPFLRPGDEVEVEFRPRFGVGDVVVFELGGRFVVHRVVGRRAGVVADRYRLKGDNLLRFDGGWIRADALLGRVRAVRRGARVLRCRFLLARPWSQLVAFYSFLVGDWAGRHGPSSPLARTLRVPQRLLALWYRPPHPEGDGVSAPAGVRAAEPRGDPCL
jgi:hypothetical protein